MEIRVARAIVARVRVIAAASLVLGALSVAPTVNGADVTVAMQGNGTTGNAFVPATATIQVGEKVTWRNDGTAPHNSSRASGPETWDSGVVAAGGTFVRTFNTAGTFAYVCSFHPGMAGTIVVQAAPAATPTPTPTQAPPTSAPTTGATATPTGTVAGATGVPTPPATDTSAVVPTDTTSPALPIALLALAALAGAALARLRLARR